MVTWVTFGDAEETNAFEDGDLIYAFVSSIKMANSNLMTPSNLPLQDWDIADGESVGSNYERRKPYINYTGMNQNVFQLKGKWVTNISTSETMGTTVKIDSVDQKVLTPFRLVRMFHSGHKFYMKDTVLHPSLYTGSPETSLYPEDGIPVAIKDFSLDTVSSREGEITFSMTLYEDKVSDTI